MSERKRDYNIMLNYDKSYIEVHSNAKRKYVSLCEDVMSCHTQCYLDSTRTLLHSVK